jgi:tRNA-dihydrouridine synthase
MCVLGSGDITSRDHAITNIQTYGLDGALIGRATWGNPWIFTGHIPTKEERLHIALTHAKLYAEMLPNGHFISLRKHMAWYMSGFHNASVLRAQMLRITSVADVEKIVEEATEGIGHKIQDAR